MTRERPFQHPLISGPSCLEIVAVAADSKMRTLGEANVPLFFRPDFNAQLLVRVAGNPSQWIEPLRSAVGEVDGTAALDIRPLEEAAAGALFPMRVATGFVGSLSGLGLPLALGHGVKIVRTAAQAEQVLLRLTKPLSALRTFKRLIVDRGPYWLPTWWKGERSTVVVQSYIERRPANCAVVCWKGKVLAGIAVEVASTQGATGSAMVVRIVDGPEMLRAAERLARRLELSGFFGLDFVIENSTGAAWLIEMNPRITPLCHLRFGPGRDLVEALFAQLSGAPARETTPVTEKDLIAYFPQALHFDPNIELVQSSFQDVPWQDPKLVRELRRLPWPNRGILARVTAWLRRQTSDEKASGESFFPAAVETRKSSCPGSRNT